MYFHKYFCYRFHSFCHFWILLKILLDLLGNIQYLKEVNSHFNLPLIIIYDYLNQSSCHLCTPPQTLCVFLYQTRYLIQRDVILWIIRGELIINHIIIRLNQFTFSCSIAWLILSLENVPIPIKCHTF